MSKPYFRAEGPNLIGVELAPDPNRDGELHLVVNAGHLTIRVALTEALAGDLGSAMQRWYWNAHIDAENAAHAARMAL